MALENALSDDVSDSTSAPHHQGNQNGLLHALTASVIATNDRFDPLVTALALNSNASAATSGDDDIDFVSTTGTDASINAFCRYTLSRRRSEFRFGRPR